MNKSINQKFRIFKSLINFFFICCGCLTLNGCMTTDDEIMPDRPAEELYHQALKEIEAESYEKAAKTFDEIERQHPYSDLAIQAQLMNAYAHYENQKYEKALAGVEIFIDMHPAYKDIAYAYYLQGLCYYEQLSSIKRDQKMTELASAAFKEIMRRFPKSNYAKDAKYKLVLLHTMLAGKEMEIGRYYQNHKAYIGAMNRFLEVIMHYQDTTHVPEALYRLVEVYKALNLPKEAQKSAAVLGHNYPKNKWYRKSYQLLNDAQDVNQKEQKAQPKTDKTLK